MKRTVELSARMQALADMVTCGNRVCDVGCDHGFLSIYLVQKNISPRVIAMDVGTGPLSRCREHVEMCGLEDYITMRLSDGLECLEQGEADTVICAGMGGRLMQKILTQGQEKAVCMKELILQPQSELKEFRRFLKVNGYVIVQENMIEEEGKFYPMMKVLPKDTAETVPGPEEEKDSSVFDRYGPLLLKERNPVLYRFLQQREQQLREIYKKLSEQSKTSARERKKEMEEELSDLQRAYEYY